MSKTFVAIALAVTIGLILLMVISGRAQGDVLPSPEPSASPTATPSPVAPPELVTWALRMRGRALRARRPLARADRCLRLHRPPAVEAVPARSCDAATWKAYGADCQALASQFCKTLKARIHKMCHPGGPASGAKWLPLAKWVGWPRSTWHTLAGLIMNESTAMPWAHNDTPPTFCRGLLQEARCWYAGRWRFNPFSALKNLYYGLNIWLLQHRSFLPAWQGDPAVGY